MGDLQRELDLHGEDFGVFDSYMDRLGPHLRQRDAPHLPSLDILLVDNPKGDFHGHRGVAAAEFEQVELLAAFELGNTVVERASCILGRGVHPVRFGIHAAFDVDADFVRVFGVLGKVPLQEHETVVVRWPVEFAAIPTVAWRDKIQP